MTVEMHRMWGSVVVPDVYSDRTVTCEVYDVPLRIIRIRVILLLRKLQDRMIVVSVERRAIHEKLFVACGVHDLVDGYVVSDSWWWERNWVIRDANTQGIVSAATIVDRRWPCCACWENRFWRVVNKDYGLRPWVG